MCNFEKYFFEFNEMMIIGKGRQNGAPFQYVPWGHVSELLTKSVFRKNKLCKRLDFVTYFMKIWVCQQLRFGDPLRLYNGERFVHRYSIIRMLNQYRIFLYQDILNLFKSNR